MISEVDNQETVGEKNLTELKMQKTATTKLVVALLFGALAMSFASCAEQQPEQQEASEARAALKAKVVYYAIPG